MDSTAVVVALVGATVSLAIGILGHRRSKQVDATSAQSGVASNHREGTAQILEGLNTLIDQLQEDNTGFRTELRDLVVRFDAVTAERNTCWAEIARLRKKYGDNGDTPQPANK